MLCVFYYHYFTDLTRKICDIYEFIFDYTNTTYSLKSRIWRWDRGIEHGQNFPLQFTPKLPCTYLYTTVSLQVSNYSKDLYL